MRIGSGMGWLNGQSTGKVGVIPDFAEVRAELQLNTLTQKCQPNRFAAVDPLSLAILYFRHDRISTQGE